MRNALFWARYIRDVFIPELSLIQRAVLTRVLPAFNNIEAEAETAEREAWERLSTVAGADSDPAAHAEQARDAGIERYLMLKSIRQATKNLFSVAVSHLVEQQQLFLLRRMFLPLDETDQHALLKHREFITRSNAAGVNIQNLEGWVELEELRLVANAVKHAEGPAVAQLRNRRPDLFKSPVFSQEADTKLLTAQGEVYRPLFGEDLFVTDADLDRYFLAAEQFWQAYAGRLEKLDWELREERSSIRIRNTRRAV